MKLSELAEQFLTLYVAVENKPSERVAKQHLLRNHILPHLGEIEIDKLRTADLVHYRAAQLKTGIAFTTLNLRLKCLQTMLNWAHEELEVLEVVPHIKMMKVVHVESGYLRPDQIRALYEVIGTEQPWAALVRVAMCCGLRIGELRALRWKNVDLVGKRIHVTETTWSCTWEVNGVKSGKPRTVPLNDTAETALRQLKAVGPLVFGLPPTGAMLGYQRCHGTLTRFFKAAGIPAVKQPTHIFRHTFGSHMAMRGVPMRTLQELMGHASVTTTARYAHLSPDVGHDAVGVLDSLFEKV